MTISNEYIMNDKEIVLSMIIPIYNVERYLEKCLDTCLKQLYQSYEIICVNDGSTDQSGSILNRYAKRYPDIIRVFHTKNNGVSMARNIGLENAKGKFVWFIDPDDYIEEDILPDIIKYLDNIDLLMLPYLEVTDNGKVCNREHGPNASEVVTRSDFKKYAVDNSINRVWKYVVLRSILIDNNILFGEGIVRSEDRAFTFFLKYKIQNYSIYDKVAYYYRLSEHSATRGMIKDDKYNKCMIDNSLAIAIYIKNNKDCLSNPEDIIDAEKYQNNWTRGVISGAIKTGDTKYLNNKLEVLRREELYPFSMKNVNKSKNMINNISMYLFQIAWITKLACKLISLSKERV